MLPAKTQHNLLRLAAEIASIGLRQRDIALYNLHENAGIPLRVLSKALKPALTYQTVALIINKIKKEVEHGTTPKT